MLLYRLNEWICMCGGRMTLTFDYKRINLFILLGVKATVGAWEAETGWRKGLPHWSITSSLDHTMLCYLRGLTEPFCFSAVGEGGYWPGGPLWTALLDATQRGTQPHAGAPVTASWDWLSQTACISWGHLHISTFITPTHFRSTTWLLPTIFIGVACAENLWLTARSRVNMQQYCSVNGLDSFSGFLFLQSFL